MRQPERAQASRADGAGGPAWWAGMPVRVTAMGIALPCIAQLSGSQRWLRGGDVPDKTANACLPSMPLTKCYEILMQLPASRRFGQVCVLHLIVLLV